MDHPPRLRYHARVSDVELCSVSRRFNGSSSAALDQLSLTVAPGELMVLVGPSGCGKSTALRITAGLDEPDQGEVRIGGRSMRGVPPQERDVAMVFQGYALYPHMKARDIMAFPLKMRGMPRAERCRRVEQAADVLSIRHLLDRRPAELSGGERQRVAMGRALVRQPRVFLFDEPLSNLDAALRADIRVEIGAIVREIGATTIYVTHDHVEAMTLGDRIAVLRAGKLEQVGTPRAIYERPETAFVASFLGSPAMLLSPAVRVQDRIEAGPIRLRLAAGSLEGEHLQIGIRPEHLRLGSQPVEGMAHFDAVVTALEPLGAETHVHLRAGALVLRTKVPGFDAPARDQTVPVYFDPRQVHAFSATARGERLDLVLEAA